MPTIDRVTRNDDGSLPAYAWPGGYAIAYLVDDGEFLCAPCANKDGHIGGDADGFRLEGYQTGDWHDTEEGPWTCAQCGTVIDADPDADPDAVARR